MCFKCLVPGHIGKFCPNEQPVCKHCKKNHLSILHVNYEKAPNTEKEGQQGKDNQNAETVVAGNPEAAKKKA